MPTPFISPNPDPRLAIQHDATTQEIREIAAYLQEHLGQKMTAYLSGVDNAKTVRLPYAYQAARLIIDAYDDETAKAWFFGSNTLLDNEAPAYVLRYGTPDDLLLILPAASRLLEFRCDLRRESLLNHGSVVWRVGHISSPLSFTPWEVLEKQGCGHRFDHPDKLFRTLYCAEQRRTALREVLSDLRPNTKARRDYLKTVGEGYDAPKITSDFLAYKMLAHGVLHIHSGDLVNVDNSSLRHQFERLNPELLAEHEMDHFDIAQVRSKNRPVTQAFTRFIAGQGAAGVVYGSNLDDQPCAALFEGKASLAPVQGVAPEPLAPCPSDLVEVCNEFGLTLQIRY